MNIFQDFKDLIGVADTTAQADALREFFMAAGEMRDKLGSKAYLLDKYISYLLECALKAIELEPVDNGFSSGSKLMRICGAVLSGSNEFQDHPITEKATAYLKAHPMPFQEEHTKLEILLVSMMGEYFSIAAKEFAQEATYEMMGVVDMIHVNKLYEQLCDLIDGDSMMDKLNAIIRQCFFPIPAMASFLHGLTRQLVDTLIQRDMETSRQMV